MPYGWGDSTTDGEETPKSAKPYRCDRSAHPISSLKVGESYQTKNKTDSSIAFAAAYRLRRDYNIDIKSKNGIFTRIK
jgi:hypothetical protein